MDKTPVAATQISYKRMRVWDRFTSVAATSIRAIPDMRQYDFAVERVNHIDSGIVCRIISCPMSASDNFGIYSIIRVVCNSPAINIARCWKIFQGIRILYQFIINNPIREISWNARPETAIMIPVIRYSILNLNSPFRRRMRIIIMVIIWIDRYGAEGGNQYE